MKNNDEPNALTLAKLDELIDMVGKPSYLLVNNSLEVAEASMLNELKKKIGSGGNPFKRMKKLHTT